MNRGNCWRMTVVFVFGRGDFTQSDIWTDR